MTDDINADNMIATEENDILITDMNVSIPSK